MGFRWKKAKRKRPPARGPKAVALAVALLMVGLVPMAIYAPRAVRDVHARLTWRAVDCEIVDVRRGEVEGRQSSRRLYRPHISYRYGVDGVTHTSDGIHLRPFRTTYRGATKLMNRYPLGSRHTCYVDPADASRAALQPINPGSIGVPVVAAPWLLIGGWILVQAVQPSPVS